MNMTYEDIEEFRKNAIERLRKEDQYATANAVDTAFGALICLGQFKWERDVAIEQLKEIGVGFGENMDTIKSRLELRQKGEWIEGMLCSHCGQVDFSKPNFCPNCGTDMRKIDGVM
jgi:hypothetical protein